jgi:hypothetical protein
MDAKEADERIETLIRDIIALWEIRNHAGLIIDVYPKVLKAN